MANESKRGTFKLMTGLFIVAVLVILFVRVLDGWLMPALKAGMKAAFPFVLGIVFAYLIRFAVSPLERWLRKLFKAKETNKKIRILAISLVIVLMFGSVVALLWGIIPGVYENIAELGKRLPDYLTSIGNWIDATLIKYNIQLPQHASEYLDGFLKNTTDKINSNVPGYIAMAGTFLLDIGKGLFNVFIAFLVAFYILTDTDKFKNLFRRVTKAVVNHDEKYKNISGFLKECDSVMGRYINGKLLESLIVTIISLIGFMVIDVKYLLLMSIIVALTNLIPYFGPWIGAVPVVLITLLENPVKSLYVIVFLVFVQIIDNYIIGPKIMGDMLKVNPFWILVGVLIGGGMFGLVGMILGAPAIALVASLVSRFIAWRNENNKKNAQTQVNE